MKTFSSDETVLKSADKASKQKRREDRYSTVFMIDRKSASISASRIVAQNTCPRISVPGPGDLLTDLNLSVRQERRANVKLSADVPQGSIIGITLYN